MQPLTIYSRKGKPILLVVGGLLIVATALLDAITPELPLGYLYLIPLVLLAGALSRPWIATVVFICAAFTAVFSRYEMKPAIILFVMAWTGFTGTAFFISEVVRNRQIEIDHIRQMETQIRLRHETEVQLKELVETSPLAIIMIDAAGKIILANDAAETLFGPGGASINGELIAEYIPTLQPVTEESQSKSFRTQIRCKGRRKNGDVFLAAVWISTSATENGSIVSAIVVDFSEDLRDREDLSLEHLLKNAKILVGAMAHEIRNLCGAVLVVYKNLSRLDGMQKNEDFQALGTLVSGLEKLSEMELRPSWTQLQTAVDLPSVLDELRVVIEPVLVDSGIKVSWKAQDNLPLIIGDRYGLLQVFLNLVRNSQKAMLKTNQKQLTITSDIEEGAVTIRFEDTGVGISDPSGLFRPFYQNAGGTGLGLYVSRAILRSFRGDLRHEWRETGCCFAVRLTRLINSGDLRT